MKKLVYFDTNVFEHLYNKVHGLPQDYGITLDMVDQLKAIIAYGKVSIVLSLLNIGELLDVMGDGRNVEKVEEAQKRIQFALDLAGPHQVVKQPKELLTNDIRAYASSKKAKNPFSSDLQGDDISEVLMDFSNESIPRLLSIVRDTKKQKEFFQSALKEGRAAYFSISGRCKSEEYKEDEEYKKFKAQEEEFKALAKKDEKQAFEEFFTHLAEGWAEVFAKRCSLLEVCQAKGISGLLNIPTVKMAVGILISYQYSQWIEAKSPEEYKPKESDFADLLHAVAAVATTKIFVAHDKRLRDRHVPRAYPDNFQARSLADFLRSL